MAVPVVGELEMSLPPCAVPTEAETVFANVGVKLTLAPYSGVSDEAAIEATGADVTTAVVVADLLPSSLDVAVMVTLPATAGAVQVPLAPFIAPALADQAIPLVAPPVAVVLNVVAVLTVRVGALGLTGFTTTVCGVTVTELSTKSPAAFVALNQKVLAAMMGTVGIGVPLTGELEISLPPCVVPTEAETAFANVGVKSTSAP